MGPRGAGRVRLPRRSRSTSRRTPVATTRPTRRTSSTWLFGERFPFAARARSQPRWDRRPLAGRDHGEPARAARPAPEGDRRLGQPDCARARGVGGRHRRRPARGGRGAVARTGARASAPTTTSCRVRITSAPEPAPSNGEGGRGRGFSAHPKDLGFQELRAHGLDTALFVLRAGTHLDFTPTTTAPSSRYGEAVATYPDARVVRPLPQGDRGPGPAARRVPAPGGRDAVRRIGGSDGGAAAARRPVGV